MVNNDMVHVTISQAKIQIAAEARRLGHEVQEFSGISNLRCTTDKSPSFFVGAVQNGMVWIPDYRSDTMIHCQSMFGKDVDVRLIIGLSYRLNHKGMQFAIVDGKAGLYGREVSLQVLKKYIDQTLELID